MALPGIWIGFALLLVVAPLVWTGSLALTILAQMGIAIVACLSYNMLLGQGGMLSFGHAVYTGLGTYAAIHALNAASRGELPLPVSLMPLAGGLGGLAVAVVLGYPTTRKSGTTFAMITLGVAELVFAVALMLTGFFGGEAGVSANRVVGSPFLGISFGPAIEVYYLIAAYTFACTAAIYAFTCTPLGRMLNAVRDNPERVEFIGYDPRRVRYLAFVIAGFFAGVAGGLAALNFEIATAEVVSPARSAAYLVFTFLGGASYFFGPILGAVGMVLAFVLLSALTHAWLLYLGLAFLVVVMWAPGGMASLVMLSWRTASLGRLRAVDLGDLALLAAGLLMLLGMTALIEMAYHLQQDMALGSTLQFLGISLDVKRGASWIGAGLATAVGGGGFQVLRRHLHQRRGEHLALIKPKPNPVQGRPL